MSDKPTSMVELIRKAQQDVPMIMEMVKMQAELLRVKFLELKAAGFSDKEAIELCKGPLIH